MTIELIILTVGILLLAAVFSCKVADKAGVPSLLLFLIVGMLAGSEGIGGIAFDNPKLAQSIGSLALMIILSDGGLATEWKSHQTGPRTGTGDVHRRCDSYHALTRELRMAPAGKLFHV